jgi:hypothetical protein
VSDARPESGASSKGEGARFVEAALTDPVCDGHFCRRPHAASDLARGEIEPGRKAFRAVVAVMVGEKGPDRRVITHTAWNLRAESLAHLNCSGYSATEIIRAPPGGQQMLRSVQRCKPQQTASASIGVTPRSNTTPRTRHGEQVYRGCGGAGGFGGGRRGGRVGFGRGGAGAVLRRNQPSRFWREPRPLTGLSLQGLSRS